ncbi:MAG: DUF4838 domain-containing protein [Ruminococcaceae bacterium]|nr:DUF4838 domain-containing protein [Oscillospiraceae bacterium]
MKKISICGRDIADFTLVLPTIPEPAEKTAAEFLKRVIMTSCGVNLPISDKAADHGIFIGSRETDPDIKWDGFRIRTDENSLYLHGNIARGTLYAAYDFAEKYIGYRYFADDCEVIPTEGEAEVPANLDIVDNPGFSARRTTCHQHTTSAEMSAHSRLNDCAPVGEKYGGVEPVNGACHTFDSLCPSGIYFDEHPEYFSYVIDEDTGEGRRIRCSNDTNEGGQLCLSHPDVIRIVTENVLKQLRENPDIKIAEVSQCDNTNYCQCERCAAIDEEEGSQAGTMIRFVNAVAEAVEKEFPDVLVRTFAYTYSRKPPKITKARHNVIVRYCTIEACSRHALNDPNCPTNADVYGKEMAEWGKMAHQISVWNYITNWCSFNAPFPILTSLRDNARFFADCGTIHFFAECNPSDNAGGVYPQLKAYLIGRLLWDPYMSEEEYERHICEFLRAYYGKGWEEIRRYIELEHKVTADREMKCFERADIGAAFFSTDVVFIPGLRDFLRIQYVPTAYQPAYPGNYLTGLCGHIDEALAMFERAYALAETDEERFHIRRSRASLDYTDLFVKSRIKGNLTAEEQKEYEARVAQFHEDIKTYNFRLNVWTNNFAGR